MACLPTPRHGLCSGVRAPLPFSPDRHCYRTSHPLRRAQQGSLRKHPASPCLPPLGCPPPLPTSQSPCEGGKGLPPAVLQQQQPCRKTVGMLAWGGTHRLGRDHCWHPDRRDTKGQCLVPTWSPKLVLRPPTPGSQDGSRGREQAPCRKASPAHGGREDSNPNIKERNLYPNAGAHPSASGQPQDPSRAESTA